VLCITHLPQIAAFSHWHARVTKADTGGRTTVAVKVLGDAEREREIARMLAGETVGATALDHARTLIRDARAEGANLPF
jgi:DNA repair protein RecN (Recombination protein N)